MGGAGLRRRRDQWETRAPAPVPALSALKAAGLPLRFGPHCNPLECPPRSRLALGWPRRVAWLSAFSSSRAVLAPRHRTRGQRDSME